MKMNWKPAAGSPAEEVKIRQGDIYRHPANERDTVMKEASKGAEGLEGSKHAVKELLEK